MSEDQKSDRDFLAELAGELDEFDSDEVEVELDHEPRIDGDDGSATSRNDIAESRAPSTSDLEAVDVTEAADAPHVISNDVEQSGDHASSDVSDPASNDEPSPVIGEDIGAGIGDTVDGSTASRASSDSKLSDDRHLPVPMGHHMAVATYSPLVADDGSLNALWSPEEDAPKTTPVRDLGQSLLQRGIITPEQLTAARGLMERSASATMDKVLFDMGADEVAIQECVAAQHALDFRRIDPERIDDRTFNKLGADFCLEHQVMPLGVSKSRLVLGMVNPNDLLVMDEIRHKLGRNIKPVVVARLDVESVIESMKEEDAEDDTGQFDEIIQGIEEDDVEVVQSKDEELDLEKMAGESPVIRFVNYLIFNAVKEGASDIHVEPQEKKLQVRYRIDGVLFEMMAPPLHMHAAIISRLKIMANLDISERRLPQDGRIRAMVHGRKLDLRLSTLPMATGEKAVMRILDTRSIQVSLDDLGMDEDALTIWKSQIDHPHGILLVTGPTGSGKTTTLYSSLNQMERSKLNISTVEDPVEYHLGGINQTQVFDRIGMTFSAALRALLRQDPDVVMLGEIRDTETATIAIQASLTGHLVLSTLHTNDAPSAVTRLINIGVEPFLIGAALNGVMAQRLVRRICDHCKTTVKAPEHLADALIMHGLSADAMVKGAGCEKCRNTGYAGRVGLYELLVLDDHLRDKIAANPNVTEFRRICVERGMITLRESGFRKVQEGVTSVDEVLRVTESAI